MFAKVYGSAIYGVSAKTITIEVNVETGIGYYLVGLPDSAIKEINYRFRTALINCGYKFPGKKITINMAPADLHKEGSAYDMTIAIGLLASSGQIKPDRIGDYLIMGELSLDGFIRPIKGVLPIAVQARDEGFKKQLL